MINNQLELLAPCGKRDMLEGIINAGADAVYVGGKRFNMRMLRPDFNFSDEELKEAVQYLHSINKKIYVTLNNIFYGDEINKLKSYLLFLENINVDAIIIQDIGVVNIYKELDLTIPLHASVQMGIANSKAVKHLEEKGFKRVILSKNLSLEEIKNINLNTQIGLEYFIHGDMCISHTGKCYFSSFFAGKSGNRGECQKPCRWQYSLIDKNYMEESELNYHLAHNDLCLYSYIDKLIHVGISSFKIEGRMRDEKYISHLVTIYRNCIDNIEKHGFNKHNDDYKKLYENRIRDFTIGNLFGKSNKESIGILGDREPFFPTETVVFNRLDKNSYINQSIASKFTPELTVKVSNIDVYKQLIVKDIDNIIINTDNIRQQSKGWTNQDIKEAISIAKNYNAKLLLETPLVVTENDLAEVEELLSIPNISSLNGLVVNDLGMIKVFSETQLPLWSGFGLNISNIEAVNYLKQQGFERITASLELDFYNLFYMINKNEEIDIEVFVQGPIYNLITDHCLASLNDHNEEICNKSCMKSQIHLVDSKKQVYRIYTDSKCRNYMLYPYDYMLLNYLPLLATMGVKSFRIDGHLYNGKQLCDIVDIYINAIEELKVGKWNQINNFNKILDIIPQGVTDLPAISKAIDSF